jgi:hypothetical protein
MSVSAGNGYQSIGDSRPSTAVSQADAAKAGNRLDPVAAEGSDKIYCWWGGFHGSFCDDETVRE